MRFAIGWPCPFSQTRPPTTASTELPIGLLPERRHRDREVRSVSGLDGYRSRYLSTRGGALFT